MPQRTLQGPSDIAYRPQDQMRDLADGPGAAPYIDGRFLAGVLSETSQVVSGVFTPGTTEDEDGDTIAAGDDVQIRCGFVPKLIVLFIKQAAATSELFLVFPGMNLIGGDEDFALKMILKADLDAAATITFLKDRIKQTNFAGDNPNYVTILNAITIDAKEHHYLIFG